MDLEITGIIQALALIGTSNGAPIIACNLMGNYAAWPVDGGLALPDHRPLFGVSKTWRGLVSAVLASAVMASIMGLPALLGAGFGAVSIGGDLLASFTKRRLGFAPSSRARLLDVFPEAILPMLVFYVQLNLEFWDIIMAALVFFVVEASFSPLLFRWHIRNRPY